MTTYPGTTSLIPPYDYTLDQALVREYTDNERKNIRSLITSHPQFSMEQAARLVPGVATYATVSAAPKPIWVKLAWELNVLGQGLRNAHAAQPETMTAVEDIPPVLTAVEDISPVAPVALADGLEALASAVVEPIATLIAPNLLAAVSANVEALLGASRNAIALAGKQAKARANISALPAGDVHGNSINLPQMIGHVFDFSDAEMLKSPYARLPVDIWHGTGCNVAIDSHFLHDAEITGQLAVYLNAGKNVLLHGPRGTGKSETVEQIAARLRRHYSAIQFSKDMDKYEILGSKLPVTKPDGSKSFEFQPGLLAQAIVIPGCVIALEELSAAPPEFGFVLQNLLSSRRLALESGNVIECADGVVFVATDNTAGFGDTSGHYHGTYTLNAALLDRFAYSVPAKRLDPENLARVVRRRSGLNDPKLELCREVCKYQLASEHLNDTQALSLSLSLRRTLAFVEAVMLGVPGDVAFTSAFTLHLPTEEQAVFVTYAQSHLPEPSNLAAKVRGKV